MNDKLVKIYFKVLGNALIVVRSCINTRFNTEVGCLVPLRRIIRFFGLIMAKRELFSLVVALIMQFQYS